MKKYHNSSAVSLIFAFFILSANLSFGQAVSINATGAAPDAQAILDLSSTTKGLLIPRMTTSQAIALATSLGTGDDGMLVYDTDVKAIKYWDGLVLAWAEIPNMGSIPAVTLDAAYDGGTPGSGSGNIITADAGPVRINGNLNVIGNEIVVGELQVGSTLNAISAILANGNAGTAGQVLLSSGGGAMTWETISSDEIVDADGDTKIQVEESADEDMIRFDTFGSERMIIDNVGKIGIGTSSPDGTYQMTVLNGSGPTVKVGGTNSGIGLLVEANAGAEDGISGRHTSTSNASSYYAVKGEVTNESGVGYLGYHTSGDNSYGVYGQSGTYAGYFDGNVNLTGELQLNGSAGSSGQVIVSQGTGVDPIWGAAGVQSVTAGDALVNSGTATALVLDVEANNGLNIDVPNNKVQLGGDLTEATEIQLEAFNLSLDLNGTGEFVVQDGNIDHFKIGNNGDASFGSDTYFKDTNTGGTDLVKISDAGTGGNDGRIEIFKDGTANHTIHGDGDVEFNESGANRNFRIESDNDANMFFLDAGTDRVGIGVAVPTRTLHVDGEARVQGLANGAGAVVISDNNGNLNDRAFTGTATDVFLGTGVFGPVSTLNDNDWLQVVSSGAPSAVGDWIYTNGNVGINYGSAANPYAALHVKTQAYIGDDNTASFFNSNAILHLARTNNPHFLMEDVGDNTGGLSFDAGGMNVVTENGDIDFRTGVTYNGDFSATGTSRMIIKNGGNVGIGTLTPDRDLHISGATGGTMMFTRNDASTSIGETLGDIQFDSEDNTGPSTGGSAIIRGIAAENHGNSNKGGHLAFLTQVAGWYNTPTEHMRITSGGNVAIGATTANVKFYVAGDAAISGKFNSNGIQESSDRRFKKDIIKLGNSLEKVMLLEAVSYNWRVEEFPEKRFGDKKEIGLIAQDLEQVYPELVSTDQDGYKSVQYSHLVPVLIEAIKEQQKQIEGLKKQADNSDSKYEDLKRYLSKIENKDK